MVVIENSDLLAETPRVRARIAHCIHGLGLGGAQQIIKYLVGGGDADRFEHYVYSSSDGVFRKEIEAAGAHVKVLPRQLPKFDLKWISQLGEAMRSDGIHMVHTHLFGDSLHGYIAAQKAGSLPVITTLHNETTDFSRLQLAGYRWLLPRSAAVVACANSAQRSFAKFMEGRNVVITAIPNGF